MTAEAGRAQVHLYGALRDRTVQQQVNRESVAWVDVRPGDRVGDALDLLSISDTDVGNLFLNGRLAAGADLLRAGDRLGVFPRDMSLLYC